MYLHRLVTNYAQFNAWANEKIINWLKFLDPQLLTVVTASSFDTIDTTLQHIHRTQKFWTAFIMETDYTTFDWSVKQGDPYLTFDDVMSSSIVLEESVALLDEKKLIEILHLNMPWAQNQLPRYEYVLHVINHSTYHRGQIITMARSLGIIDNIPSTDYNRFNSIRQ